MLAIKNAELVMRDHFIPEAVLFVEDGKIVAVYKKNLPAAEEGITVIDGAGCYAAPGFVDIHTHGAMNEDFSDGKPEGLQTMSHYYAAQGVTTFLATTMTLKEETLTPAMEVIRDFIRPADGAKCARSHPPEETPLPARFLFYTSAAAKAPATAGTYLLSIFP